MGLYAGLNTYAYAYSAPTNHSDPSGLIVPLAIPGLCAAGGCEAIAVAAADAAAWWAGQHPVTIPVDPPMEARSRGRDPVTLPHYYAGVNCYGSCIPCRPGASWKVNKPGHGHPNGYIHEIVYSQTDDCWCRRPTEPRQGVVMPRLRGW